MGRSFFLIVFAFVLVLLLFFYLSQSLSIVQRIATVDRVEGKVEAKWLDSQKWRQLRRGDLVRAREVVRTGPKSSCELHWAGGMRARLGENTRFIVQKSTLNRSNKQVNASLRMDLGSLWMHIRRVFAPDSKFEVETPTVVAAVRGTIFSVKVAADGVSSVECYDGEVSVKGKTGTALVGRGAAIAANASQMPAQSRPLSQAELADWQKQPTIIAP